MHCKSNINNELLLYIDERFKNFCEFCGFALHYEFAESAENSESFILLAAKDWITFYQTWNFFFSKKMDQGSFLLEK